jgi:3-phenylpropionate/trans-cinnamate dioxygenase ferredoxin reductase subunit
MRTAVPGDVVVVGGGVAAVRVAQGLRDLGYEGRIRLASDEHELPYDRPPLSKAFLLGETDAEAIRLLDAGEAEALGVELLLGRRAVAVDTDAACLTLDDGEVLRYGALVIATGARPRELPAVAAHPDVHRLRTLDDARRLRAALVPGRSIALLGGGFVGLEVAAAARAADCSVTVVELAPRPLAPVIGGELGGVVQAWHEDHGVVFHCGTVACVVDPDDGSLVLDDGSVIAADSVVVGVGMLRELAWLHLAGIDVHRGVVCDADGRTSALGVYAAGDVACRHANARCLAAGHWTSANEQALRVAAAIVGRSDERPISSDGYFWSDQYGVRLQFAGWAGDGVTISVESGTYAKRRLVAYCRNDAGVTGVFALNDPRGFVRARVGLGRVGLPEPGEAVA